METNSLEPRQQAKLLWDLIKQKPMRTAALLVAVVIGIIASTPHDLLVVKYTAQLGDADDRRIETLLIVNPNTGKREMVAQLAPTGKADELGFDYAYAVDLSSKSEKFLKMDVGDSGLAVLNLLRKKGDPDPIRIMGTKEVNQTGAVMGSIALAYLLSWFAIFGIYSNAATVGLSISILYNPAAALGRYRQYLHRVPSFSGQSRVLIRVTISYRREDSGVITGRIFDRLVARYGRDSVFRDIDNIPPGVDFREHLNLVLDKSDIVLALVGPRWMGSHSGQVRLADEADPVRVEIETALRKGVTLIPVLVMSGTMPRASQLPDTMKEFAYRNAVQVDAGQDFDVHMDRLLRAMDRILDQKTDNTRVPRPSSD